MIRRLSDINVPHDSLIMPVKLLSYVSSEIKIGNCFMMTFPGSFKTSQNKIPVTSFTSWSGTVVWNFYWRCKYNWYQMIVPPRMLNETAIIIVLLIPFIQWWNHKGSSNINNGWTWSKTPTSHCVSGPIQSVVGDFHSNPKKLSKFSQWNQCLWIRCDAVCFQLTIVCVI